ncbi:MAG TPA: hypothetical protein VFB78_03255 [Acidimicrobiales bacterium]|nr:hypothetical protein [Acidimicrobiales bacterium]
MATPLSRRTFLAASAGLVVAACGKDKKADVTATPTTESNELSIVPGAQQVLAGIDERVPFLVFQGQTPTVAHPAEVGFAAGPKGQYGPGIKAEAHRDGIETRPYYLVRQTFPAAGLYRMGVNIAGGSAEAAFEVVDPATVKTPIPGKPLPSVKTPTVADPMGVNPICTASPACPWHDVSLDAALKQKRPVVFYVGTPARCQTKTCGPVLNVLQSLRAEFEPKARFVHLEVYTSLTGDTTIPAIDELHLESEPWIFLVGADGVIRDRYAGPVDRTEARAGLAKLTS